MIGASVIGAALTTFACGGDNSGGGAPEQDSGTDAVIDRVRVDTGNPGDEDAGEKTWCTEQPSNTAVFCDDFDPVSYDMKTKWTTVTEEPGASAVTGNAEKTSGDRGLRLNVSASTTDGSTKLVELEKDLTDLNKTNVFLWEFDMKAASCAGWSIHPDDGGTGDDAGDDAASDDGGMDIDAGDPQIAVTFASLYFGDNTVYLGATADRQFVIRESQVGNEAVHTTPFYIDGSFQRVSIQVTPGATKKATVLKVTIASPTDIDSGAASGVDIPIGTDDIKASVVKATIRNSVVATDQTCTVYFDNVLLSQSHGAS